MLYFFIWREVKSLKRHGYGTAFALSDSHESAVQLVVAKYTEWRLHCSYGELDEYDIAAIHDLTVELTNSLPNAYNTPSGGFVLGSE